MQYLLLIYADESVLPKPGTPEFDTMIQGYYAIEEEWKTKGIMKGGEALENVSTATTVRVRQGQAQTLDGPFAETKEQLGGFFFLDCQDLDEAIECAKRIPGAAIGSIEIRPIMPTCGGGG